MDIKVIETSEGFSLSVVNGLHLSSLDAMHTPSNVYGLEGLYLNRLIVHEKERRQGIGTALMLRLTDIADDKQLNLLLEINPYGEMNYKELEGFYSNFGFVKGDLEGLFVRVPTA